MSDETLLLNHAGQDIEFRIAPDGKANTEWIRLPGGSTLPVTLPGIPCIIEFRLGGQTVSESIDKPVAAIEVSQILRIKSRRRLRPPAAAQPRARAGRRRAA